ncbi:MAG: hypothetical protein GY814_05665 [Gammaproteobacteria bacterium]|nr:hypothetical protein [Gammaproteobacteria bacterium]
MSDYEGKGSDLKPNTQSQSIFNDWSSVVSLHPENSNPSSSKIFKFLDFRTFRTALYTSVALEFESIDGLSRVTAFFGVKLKSSQGTKYEPGVRGQFIPPKHGDFRKFWMQVVGEEPFRWCRVHKSMHNKLRGKLFTGKIYDEVDGKGNPYSKLKDPMLFEQAQIGHK